MLMTLEHSKL